MTFSKKGLSLLLLVLTAAAGKAQDSDKELDPVTVTSGYNPVKSSRTGRNIEVIRGEQLLRLPASSVDELLRYVPGVEVQARGPMGTQSDIVMRGGTFQQVLVIMDGIRLNDPFSGHFSAYFPVTPAEIDRIEVLKGAAAALYGSEAVGGVVHIITKTFAARHGVASRSLQAQAGAGSFQTLNGQAGGHLFDGRTGFSGGLLSNNSDGPQQRGTRGGFNVHTASFGLHHFFTPALRLAFRSSYDERDFSAQNFYTTTLADTAAERVRTYWNQASLTWERTKDRYTFDAGYKATRDFYRYYPSSSANENQSGLWQVNVRNEHRFSEDIGLSSAVQFMKRTIESNDRGAHGEHGLSGVTALSWRLSGFTLAPALRLDWNERRGAELVPQLSLSYRSGAWQLRGAAGKTIRDADFTERYNNYLKPLVPNGNRVGNPGLQAERATSVEAGADYFAGKYIRVSGSFFQRWHKGLIDYVPTAYADMPRRDNLTPGARYGLAQNIADLTITGAELDLHYRQPLRKADRALEGSAGFTWAEAGNSSNANGFYLTSFAKYLFNAHLAYSSPRLTVGFTGIYKERVAALSAPDIKAELSKDYFVLNGKVNFFILPRRLGIFVQADNIFDRSYSDLLGAQMPGRWWLTGLQVKL